MSLEKRGEIVKPFFKKSYSKELINTYIPMIYYPGGSCYGDFFSSYDS